MKALIISLILIIPTVSICEIMFKNGSHVAKIYLATWFVIVVIHVLVNKGTHLFPPKIPQYDEKEENQKIFDKIYKMQNRRHY